MRSIVAAGIGLLCCAAGWAQPRALMSDPVFGIIYDSQEVHFEYAPTLISQFCPSAQAKTFWVYARWKAGDLDFFILSNRDSELAGYAVVLRGKACSEGLPPWILTGDPLNRPGRGNESIFFSETILRGLATDLLRRYAVAFGGKKSFLEAVRKGGLPSADLPPVLRSEFEKFAKSP